MNISTGRKERAQKVVLYGPEGIGKTSLAAAFPDPLFIDTEGSTAPYDVRRADPSPTSWAMLMGYVGEVASGGVPCSTLVIDTADWAERLCIAKVCGDKGKSSIEDWDYGKGYTYVKEEFGRLLDRLSDVAERGVNVVVCAHAMMRKFEQPDELGTYDRWELKLLKQCAPLVKEWADMLLFLNYETTVVTPDRKTGGKAKAMGGKRVMFAEHHPAWDAKNRHGLPGKMPLDYAQIAHAIPDMRAGAAPIPAAPASMGQAAAEPQAAAARGPVSNPAPSTSMGQAAQPAIDPARLEFEEVPPGADAGTPPADAGAPVSGNGAGASVCPEHLKPLRDLMAASGASEADVTSYTEGLGWMAKGTPLAAYPPEAVSWLVANWETVGRDIPTPIK